MKRQAMASMGHCGNHICAPKAWRDVPILTSDYDLDGTILNRDNADLPDRLSMYLRREAYGIRTGYGKYGDND